MKVWILNNYNMLPEHGPMNRHYHFGLRLKELDHEPVVFVGSHPHNTNKQFLEGPEKYKVYQENPFPWVLVKTMVYGKSRKKQVLSMFQYYMNGEKATKYVAERYGRPDVILGSSAHPLAALLAVQLGRKYGCRSVVEIRDLWPESIVAYGIAGPYNPAVVVLRWLEKWLYKHADAVVFTQEGAYDYIVERGWEKDVPQSKVFYVNNGVNLDAFRHNRDHFKVEDPDLDNPKLFKIVYTGSVRKVNNLGALLDAAKRIADPSVRFLIWGGGDELDALRRRVKDEKIENVIFKGPVEKKYIPCIISKADANLIHGNDRGLSMLRYGISANKMFDYLAAEKPVLMDLLCGYNPLVDWNAGLCVSGAEELPALVEHLRSMNKAERELLGRNTCRAAEAYDFKNLTEKLLDALEGRN